MLHVIPGEWKNIIRDCAPNTNIYLGHQIQDMTNLIYTKKIKLKKVKF